MIELTAKMKKLAPKQKWDFAIVTDGGELLQPFKNLVTSLVLHQKVNKREGETEQNLC